MKKIMKTPNQSTSPTAPHKCPQVPKVSFLKKFSDFVQSISKTITGLIVLLVIVVAIFLGYKSFKLYSVIIEPFNVPSAIEKEGYNGNVVANKLVDQINYIRTFNSQKEKINDPVFSPGWLSEKDDVKIPDVGISFGYILRQIGKSFGCKTDTISNDAFMENNELKVTTRINSENPQTFTQYANENLDTFLLRIAEHVSKYTQPTQLATYYYMNGKYDYALSAVQYIISNEPKSDDSAAYVVWGNVLYAQNKYQEAIEKYKKAIGLAPKDFASNINLALAYEKSGELDKAVEQYKKILDTIHNAPSVVSINLAKTYIAQGEEGKAVEALTTAVENDQALKEEIKEEPVFKTLEASPSFQEVIK